MDTRSSGNKLRNRKLEADTYEKVEHVTQNTCKTTEFKRGCVKSACLTLTIFVVILPLGLLTLLGIWPSKYDSQPFEYMDPPKFVGPLSKNNLLSKAEKLLEGNILGPEAIALRNGVIFTGTADGRVLRIQGNKKETITSTGIKICDPGDISNEAECGRPLGARMDNQGNLLVVDSLYGLYRINISTGVKDLIFSTKYPLEGKKSIFLNDVAISSDGTIFVSDSSTRWTRPEFLLLGLENKPDGRIIRINPKDGSATVLVNEVAANGIQISKDESELIIADVVRCRLLSYKLKSKNSEKQSLRVLSENLPGNPDNIRNSSNGGYWVALTAVRNGDYPAPVWEKLGPYPQIRNIICKLYGIWTSWPIKDIRLMISPPKKGKTKKKYGLIIEVDSKGQIVRSFHDPTAQIVSISHVEENKGYLYLGSAFNDYIGKLPLV